MKFTTAITAATTAAAIVDTIPPAEAFARPLHALSRSSSRVVDHDSILSPMSSLSLRGGGGFSVALTTEFSEIVTIPTSPIQGMRPGTSGLRKKVEIWMSGQYLENFIQSLIDTAVYSNGGNMLDT